jgi:hypothetical protein
LKLQLVQAISVSVTDDSRSVDLQDGRTIIAPLLWFPGLVNGTQAKRENYRLIGRGEGIHGEELDEDVSVENLLAGMPSQESQKSLQRWISSRANKAG